MDDGNSYLPIYYLPGSCLLEIVNEHLSYLLALSFIVKYWVQEILVVLLFTKNSQYARSCYYPCIHPSIHPSTYLSTCILLPQLPGFVKSDGSS